MRPRGAEMESKLEKDGSKRDPRTLPKEGSEKSRFLLFSGGPRTLRIELSLQRELNFHFSMGL